jgi:V-type H+-transporting ATPase subunit a
MTSESSVFFPEEMLFIELAVPHECSYHVIKQLAGADLVHFVDCREGVQVQDKRYSEEYMQCEDVKRSLRFIRAQLETCSLLPSPPTLAQFEAEAESAGSGYRQLLPQIEELDAALRQRISSTQLLTDQRRQREIALKVLRFYRPILHEHGGDPLRDIRFKASMELELLGRQSFIFSLSGVVEGCWLRPMFVRMYRTSRGNVILSQGSDPDSSDAFFTVWFQTSLLGRKLSQIALSYGATVFDFPLEESGVDSKERDISCEIEDITRLLSQTYADNLNFLTELQRPFWFWWFSFLRESLVYSYIDFGDFSQVDHCAVYKGWIPARRRAEVDRILEEAMAAAGTAHRIAYQLSKGTESPPTLIETNEFTAPFQLLNDSYGYADSDEVNGGAFYAMYPFLFGIMFVDVGHSFFFLFLVLAMIVLHKKLSGMLRDMEESILGFRYFLLLMAICGMSNGFIYNEFFGLPVDFFRSRWVAAGSQWNRTDTTVYPFGLDPVWMLKDNELIFTNSLKMKIAVTMGITQMVFGMILQLIKQIRRRAWLNLWLRWLPQMLYLCSFFAYMVFIIIYKWCTGKDVNLIQVLINMILRLGSLDPDEVMYEGQNTVQIIVVVVFIGSIPVMLFVKPIVEMLLHGVGDGILECFVVTLIEVIEFTLSALSHTASYLRLWALSLAHSQLARVLWDELFVLTVDLGFPVGMFGLFIGFAAWAGGSVAILLGMECFSSLLHGIRLMWVEFSSKFYSGTGYEFLPLSFKREIERENAQS